MGVTHRVLLTGAGGFVGSQLARLLVRGGHEVTALISPSTNRWRIRDIETELLVVDSDLRNLEAIEDRIRAACPDICIHLAWHGWAGQAAPEENLTSLSVSLELLKLMPAIGCERFVAAGTCYEYDLQHERLAETTPLRPENVYGLCKKSLFEVAQEFSTLTGVRVLTPRLFYSYGPYEDRRRVVPTTALAVLRGELAKMTPGLQVRDYLHVEDVASAIWTAATSRVTGAVNIASGEAVTVAEIGRTIGELLDKPNLIALGAVGHRENDPMRVLADATLLRRDIGWSPRYALRDGLAQTLAWWEGQVGRSVTRA
jgi:nucleoside-diphosphate-sugar epimerase